MALNKNESKTIYLSISDGALVRQHPQAIDGVTKERITKTGKLVWEERFKDLTGMIIGVDTRENDYGKQLTVRFKDGDEWYQISMPYSSRYSSSFLKALPNVNLTQSVRFMPWAMPDKTDNTKTVTGITIYQGKDKIAPKFTKDNPGDMPQMKQIKVKGKVTWDDSDMMEFLEKMARSLFAATLSITVNTEETPF